MSNGLAYIYNITSAPPPSRDRYWRVPDYVALIDAEGRFTAPVVEGRYCVGAVKRVPDAATPSVPVRPHVGPPQEGDYLLISADERGTPREYAVLKGALRDIGTVEEGLPFHKVVNTGTGTSIEGTILSPEGLPLEGVLVFAFVTPSVIGKPLFVSDRSDREGRFVLNLFAGGTYYLKARNVYGGGPPRTGEAIDGKREEPLVAVSVKDGETSRGVSLEMRRFPGRGPEPRGIKPGKQSGASKAPGRMGAFMVPTLPWLPPMPAAQQPVPPFNEPAVRAPLFPR
jgi:hypothetical protein